VNARLHSIGRARVGAKRARDHTAHLAIWLIPVLALLAVPLRSRAQLPQLQAPPTWGKVPQGTGACSIEKSCADLAPGMIRDALGASPVEQDVRELTEISSPAPAKLAGDTRAAAWTEAALRRSGADEVRVETVGSSDSMKIVVADVRGRDLPRDYVVLAAPLIQNGSAPLATAENASVLIDAVRVIHATGNIPRRSIRFLFYPGATEHSGENFGALWTYLRAHGADLDHIVAAVSIDAASGPLDGYSLEDRPEMLSSVRAALEPLRSVGINDYSEGVQVEASMTPFWLEGIPTLVATSPGGGTAHATVDAATLQQLKRGVAVAAVTAYALADAQARIAPRRSSTEVQRSIASLGIEAQLKAAGLWAEW
jgi:hypothetical protein